MNHHSMNKAQWLAAWRTYRESGWLRSVSLDGKDTARLCSEANIQRHNAPYPYASLRDRLACFKLRRLGQDTFIDHRSTEELEASYPRMTMYELRKAVP